MSENVKVLLTDEFVSFAKQISSIVDKKKARESEFKQVYDQFKADMKVLDAEAEECQAAWEQFKAEKEAGNG